MPRRKLEVLMKKLDFMEDEDQSADDALLSYFKLFVSPLFGPMIKALTVLCGLDGDTGADSSLA
jgi:hypothetical protein